MKTTTEKAIYFDMDGTLADLYGVNDWLPLIRSYSTAPYETAKPLCSMQILARLLNKLQKQGWIIGIISWTSKDESIDYHHRVERAKKKWLTRHLPSVDFDELHIVPYGWDKHMVAHFPNGILFDDSEEVRNMWVGEAFDEKDIIEILKSL